jgi:hypothetical protein
MCKPLVGSRSEPVKSTGIKIYMPPLRSPQISEKTAMCQKVPESMYTMHCPFFWPSFSVFWESFSICNPTVVNRIPIPIPFQYIILISFQYRITLGLIPFQYRVSWSPSSTEIHWVWSHSSTYCTVLALPLLRSRIADTLIWKYFQRVEWFLNTTTPVSSKNEECARELSLFLTFPFLFSESHFLFVTPPTYFSSPVFSSIGQSDVLDRSRLAPLKCRVARIGRTGYLSTMDFLWFTSSRQVILHLGM